MKLLRPVWRVILFASVMYGLAGAASRGENVRPEAADSAKREKHRKRADEFFRGPVLSVALTLPPEQFAHLKAEPRTYVPGSLRTGEDTYSVAVKLKGSAGSFQNLDAKPGFSLNFEKLGGVERFYGMKKIHLNNSVQDGTYLNELMGGAIARQAGVPASRCTHAFVSLNGRDLGLYVVKEGFTKDFLSYFFADVNGDLWDGGFCKEVEENMERDQGDPQDKTALKEFIAACHEGNDTQRWALLGKVLDVDKFASFCVLEDFLCHWDGYNFNRNNYRLYRDATTGKFCFFLHGMDQLFGDVNFPVRRNFDALVGSAYMRCPEGAALYRTRALALYETVFKAIDWPARVDEEAERVRAAIAVKNPEWAKDFQNHARELRQRIEQRVASFGRQLGDFPAPFAFDANGVAGLEKGWHEENPGGARLERCQLENQPCLHLVAEGATSASWRLPVRLDAGKYRFEATARTAGVAASDDAKGRGAGLRISGSPQKRANSLEGDTGWKPISFEFECGSGETTLVAELRATKGEVWYRTNSLRLVRVK